MKTALCGRKLKTNSRTQRAQKLRRGRKRNSQKRRFFCVLCEISAPSAFRLFLQIHPHSGSNEHSAAYTRSTMVAMPMPPPAHRVTRP